jgi:hypothetical protein
LFLFNDIEKSVVAYPEPVVSGQLALQLFDVRAAERVYFKLWINDAFDSVIQNKINVLLALAERLGFSNLKCRHSAESRGGNWGCHLLLIPGEGSEHHSRRETLAG